MVPSFEDVFEPTKKTSPPKVTIGGTKLPKCFWVVWLWGGTWSQNSRKKRSRRFWGQVRCGGTIYEGQFWQLPQHASRAKILEWLQPTWRGQTWPGWPGAVQGCGRPFRFPTNLSVELRNEGCLGQGSCRV